MVKNRGVKVFLVTVLAVWAVVSWPAGTLGAGTLDAVADRLVQTQGSGGSWAEYGFNGSIVAGMVKAYEATGNEAYAAAARLGGEAILANAKAGFFGDESYALMRLSQIDPNPANNQWRSALAKWYMQIWFSPNGIAGYVSWYYAIDTSTAIFYLSNDVVAAFYVNAPGKAQWRKELVGLMTWLNDDMCKWPVMALGVATWALAQTGPLGEEFVPGGLIRPLSDLPGMLLSHQVPPGQPNAGTFYWRFDHGDDGTPQPVSGSTEDTVFAVLGLMAANAANPSPVLDAAIAAAAGPLLGAADANGDVHVSLDQTGVSHQAYAGELLQVLPSADAGGAEQ